MGRGTGAGKSTGAAGNEAGTSRDIDFQAPDGSLAGDGTGAGDGVGNCCWVPVDPAREREPSPGGGATLDCGRDYIVSLV